MSADPNPMAEAMAQMLTVLEPVFEAARGLRDRLVAEGWSPKTAEQIAFDMVQVILNQLKQQSL